MTHGMLIVRMVMYHGGRSLRKRGGIEELGDGLGCWLSGRWAPFR